MKYAWVCAHCGAEAFFTNRIPERGKTLMAHHWVDREGKPPQLGSRTDCPDCHNGLIISPAYMRSPLGKKSPQTTVKQPESEGTDLPACPGDTH